MSDENCPNEEDSSIEKFKHKDIIFVQTKLGPRFIGQIICINPKNVTLHKPLQFIHAKEGSLYVPYLSATRYPETCGFKHTDILHKFHAAQDAVDEWMSMANSCYTTVKAGTYGSSR